LRNNVVPVIHLNAINGQYQIVFLKPGFKGTASGQNISNPGGISRRNSKQQKKYQEKKNNSQQKIHYRTGGDDAKTFCQRFLLEIAAFWRKILILRIFSKHAAETSQGK